MAGRKVDQPGSILLAASKGQKHLPSFSCLICHGWIWQCPIDRVEMHWLPQVGSLCAIHKVPSLHFQPNYLWADHTSPNKLDTERTHFYSWVIINHEATVLHTQIPAIWLHLSKQAPTMVHNVTCTLISHGMHVAEWNTMCSNSVASTHHLYGEKWKPWQTMCLEVKLHHYHHRYRQDG